MTYFKVIAAAPARLAVEEFERRPAASAAVHLGAAEEERISADP